MLDENIPPPWLLIDSIVLRHFPNFTLQPGSCWCYLVISPHHTITLQSGGGSKVRGGAANWENNHCKVVTWDVWHQHQQSFRHIYKGVCSSSSSVVLAQTCSHKYYRKYCSKYRQVVTILSPQPQPRLQLGHTGAATPHSYLMQKIRESWWGFTVTNFDLLAIWSLLVDI